MHSKVAQLQRILKYRIDSFQNMLHTISDGVDPCLEIVLSYAFGNKYDFIFERMDRLAGVDENFEKFQG